MANATNELATTYTAKQIDKLIAYFGDNAKSGYHSPRASGITSWSLLAAHARPSTHAQAQANAKAIMLRLGFNIESAFNTGSAWHGSPRSNAITYKADGPLARYSAAARTPIGNFVMRCITHTGTRLNCVATCEQGLYNADANKWLGELALGLTIGKPKATRQARKATKVASEATNPATPNVEGDNNESEVNES